MRLGLLCLVIGSVAFASNSKLAPPSKNTPVPFDADLFRRDAQVISGHGEFLYWRVQEGALDYALKMRGQAWGPTPSYAQGVFKNGTFNGDPGFRLAMSFFRAPKYWEVKWQYTRLTAAGSNSANAPTAANQFLTGTWPQLIATPLRKARSYLHLNYNTADLLVDRFFNPNPHLRLRLIGGGTVAWMNQDWNIYYSNALGQASHVRNRWKYVGGGFRVGTMVDWYWGLDVYVTALATTGLLMGSYQNQAEQTTSMAVDAADNPSIPVRHSKYQDVRSVYTLQFYFGPSYQKNFTNNRIEVFLGYEINSWFNIHEVYRSTASTAAASKETWINGSGIALQGLTTRLTVDF
ncbi:MAG: hypothetical protein RL235_1167 [Chlamydiota bacterium]|jgi:hypothetical protein